MKIKANGFEVLSGVNGTKLLFEVDKKSVKPLIHWNNNNSIFGDLSVEIQKWSEKRSVDANAYFHVLVHKIAVELNAGNDEVKVRLNLEYGTPATDKNGDFIYIKVSKDTDISKIYQYAKWVKDQQERVLTSYYLLYKRTSELSVNEMYRLIEGTISEAKELGLATIRPEEKARMMALWGSK